MTATATPRTKRRRPTTLAGDLGAALLAVAAEVAVPSWPSPVYADDPVRFSRELLRVQIEGELLPLELLPEQERILAALAPRNARVTVASGHKCGKDCIASIAALWFYCSYPGARVLITAPSDRQVNGITWREIKLRYRHARVPLGGEIGELARTGLVASDLREIKGFTARTPEAVAGISGPHVFYIVTEASGVEDPIFEAMEGNLAGRDARVLLISNPTRKKGYFFDSHHGHKSQWTTFHLSSRDIAAAQERAGREIPALATTAWCDGRLGVWGKDDPRYRVRVLGEFVESEEDKVFSLELVTEAQARWADVPVVASDPLHVGVDPAYGGRDEIAVAFRRGRKILSLHRFREPDTRRAAEVIATLIGAELRPGEDGCSVRVDKGGEHGWKFVRDLISAVRVIDPLGARIAVRGVSFAEPVRRAAQFIRFRDELWFTLREWVRDGGAFPEDEKLEEDLLAPKFTQHDNGKVSVEPKDSIRQRLGRSTDTADAVILAVWSHAETRDYEQQQQDAGEAPAPEPEPLPIDPYQAMSVWGRS